MVRVGFGQLLQCGPQRIPDQFQAAECAHRGQHMGGGAFLFGQPGPEFAQHRVVEAGILQHKADRRLAN